MAKYFDHNANPLSRMEWVGLCNDKSYCLMRHYLNDKFRLRVIWTGGPVEDVGPAVAAQFVVAELKPDKDRPHIIREKIVDTVSFGDPREAVNAYEHFLVTYTECEWLDRGPDGVDLMFLEQGNLIVADPNSPDSTESDIVPEEFGSW